MDDLRRVKLRLSRALRKAFEAHGEILMRAFATLQPKTYQAPVGGPWWRRAQGAPGQPQRIIVAADLLNLVSQTTAETSALFLGSIDGAVQQAMRIGGKAAIASVGLPLTFTLAHPQAVQYLDRCADELLEQINSIMCERIVESLKRPGARHIDRDLRRLYWDMALNRSRHIAATIVADAHQAGSAIVIRDLQDAGIRVAQCGGSVSSVGSCS